MDWLRNNSFIVSNRPPPRPLLSPEEEYDPTACYDSFQKHWQQAYKIIQRAQQMPSRDDVLEVVRNLEKLVTLLLYDVKKIDHLTLPITASSKCLEFLLGENILDKLFEWGIRTGIYRNVLQLELLKLYEMLVSQSRHLLLVHEPFLKPMLKLLVSCQGEVFELDMEKKLVALLYQLCVLLMQNVDLVDLFILKDKEKSKFIIFDLLKPLVHRDDSIGMQARDSLLLCMNLTKKNKNVANYITKYSNMCVLLATGLSGLYSILSHVLNDISVPDWHRLTPDDVNDIKELSSFVTSLEFCNAVAQIAHPAIGKQLQEFLYQGFLIPVLGPALLQTTIGEQIAATAYLELILRTVTHPGLLYSIVRFLLKVEYDGQRLLHILMQRINAEPQMSLVSLALFETLVNLNCEDVMLELVFQYLEPCLHLMLSQRRMLLPLDPHCQSFEIFLALAPVCCDIPLAPVPLESKTINWNHYGGGQQSLYGNYHAYLCDARNRIGACQLACSLWTNSYAGMETSTNIEEVNAGTSSGYVSLKSKLGDSDDDSENTGLPQWQQSDSLGKPKQPTSLNGQLNNETDHLTECTAGPFLTVLMEKVKNLLNNTIYVNLHLTGLISRLAVYSHPLLRTYLLDHSIVLQPNVPSLFQILGLLKQKIDEFVNRQPDRVNLIQQARSFLVDRETRLVNARRNALDRNSFSSTSTESPSEQFQRNSPKRRSFTPSLSSLSTIFTRRSSHAENSIQLLQRDDMDTLAIYPKFNEAQHVSLCAVLLDEWLKELAALAQEHTISQLAAILK